MRIPILGPSWSQSLGYKGQTIGFPVRNEDTFNIAAGTPIVLAGSGTDDGVAVLNVSTQTLAGTDIASIGLAGQPIAINQIGESIVFGLHLNALVMVASRSASTAGWPSWPAIPLFGVLTIKTAFNCLSNSGTAGVIGYGPFYIAFQACASGTTQASGYTATNVFSSIATTNSASTDTVNVLFAGTNGQGFKVFVRAI